ncbi:MAG TPA: hypothetical protein VFH68_21805 [Polyangia bacterium]|nr:hypothetical protein [Polyangia bacterium]
MTIAALLLGALLAQGHGAKASARSSVKSGASSGTRAGARTSAPRAAAGPVQVQRPGPPRAAVVESGGGGEEGGKGAAVAGGDGSASGSGKTFKSKTYNFGAMDVEGKLKTPQLLYFLNRVKLELDMSAPDTRSFMKELERSADDKSL